MLGDTDYYKGSSADSEKSLGTDMSSSYLSIVHQRDDSIGVDSTEQLRTLTEEVFVVFLFYCFKLCFHLGFVFSMEFCHNFEVMLQ